jgi:PAS domain S-box-containing protein
MKILIVEDHDPDRYLLETLLKRSGYAVVTAANGAEALDQARSDLPDMIISDVLMPVMDGFTLCREWIKDERLRRIPFIFYTATYTDSKDEELALNLGADAFIRKPEEPEVFLKKVKEIVEAHGAGRLEVTSEPAEEEIVLLKEYNEALIRKLEDKLVQLEAAHQELNGEIYERRRALEALADSEEKYRLVVENANEAIVIVQEDRHRFANLKAQELYGVSQEELLSRPFIEFLHPEDREMVRERYLGRIDGREIPSIYSLRLLDSQGGVKWAEVNAVRVFWEGKPATLNFLTDITERRTASEALRGSEKKYRQLHESLRDAFVRVAMDGRIMEFNDSYRKMLGYAADELQALTYIDLTPENWHAGEAAIVQTQILPKGYSDIYEKEYRRKDGTVFPVELRTFLLRDDAGTPSGMWAIVRDLTERKQAEQERRALEEQLRQSQKMEGIGRLAGGVAHDFNNLLTSIIGHTELMLMTLKETDPLTADLEEIKKAANRAAGLTRQLLAFSRRQMLQPKVLDLNLVIEDLGKMLKRLIGEDVELSTVPQPGLGLVKVDPGQIEQVIVNLVVNARDALPGGGKLTIETSNVEFHQAQAYKHVEMEAGSYVLLAITDDGLGMDEETQDHIFEPFFTTKELGKGTGLGLSTVYGIVKQSGGYVWVYSEPGQGTTFKIYFPRSAREGEKTDQENAIGKPSGGSETILLVEDDAQVRRMTGAILEKFGYRVLETRNGEEALRTVKEEGGPIHLMITDMVMPLMGGRELGRRMRTLRPETKVLYMSGYSSVGINQNGFLEPASHFLQKPFSLEGLARKIREILDDSASNLKEIFTNQGKP